MIVQIGTEWPGKREKIQKLIEADPTYVSLSWSTCFLRFANNPEVRYHMLAGMFTVDCWWNEKGNTYQGHLRILVDKVDEMCDDLLRKYNEQNRTA